ncbi:hypothetical protein AURDEDRAFT_128142 [Auricularia subglabra TFB-10046 SS5]|nr:hypothetical protein AURDEDRAFT_128142 [Auricularia subglabra TFB-10046 SS5]
MECARAPGDAHNLVAFNKLHEDISQMQELLANYPRDDKLLQLVAGDERFQLMLADGEDEGLELCGVDMNLLKALRGKSEAPRFLEDIMRRASAGGHVESLSLTLSWLRVLDRSYPTVQSVWGTVGRLTVTYPVTTPPRSVVLYSPDRRYCVGEQLNLTIEGGVTEVDARSVIAWFALFMVNNIDVARPGGLIDIEIRGVAKDWEGARKHISNLFGYGIAGLVHPGDSLITITDLSIDRLAGLMRDLEDSRPESRTIEATQLNVEMPV